MPDHPSFVSHSHDAIPPGVEGEPQALSGLLERLDSLDLLPPRLDLLELSGDRRH